MLLRTRATFNDKISKIGETLFGDSIKSSITLPMSNQSISKDFGFKLVGKYEADLPEKATPTYDRRSSVALIKVKDAQSLQRSVTKQQLVYRTGSWSTRIRRQLMRSLYNCPSYVALLLLLSWACFLRLLPRCCPRNYYSRSSCPRLQLYTSLWRLYRLAGQSLIPQCQTTLLSSCK